MTTDIHDLDQYIGQYVSITQGKDGMAGFVVNVVDKVEYTPKPVRMVVLDYGYGFPVGTDTEIALAAPPPGETAPGVDNPIQVMHLAAHVGSECADGPHCPKAACARDALRAFRVWQMKQADAYWKYRYVRWAQTFKSDPVSLGDILRDARDEGAPPHILDGIQNLAGQASKGSA